MSWKPTVPVPELRIDPADRWRLLVIATIIAFWTVVLLVQRYDAPTLLVGGVLLVGLIPLLRRPELATLVTVFLLYINVPGILTQEYQVPSVVAGAFILLLAIPLVRLLVIKRGSLKADATFGLMLLLLAAYVVSSFSAIDGEIANERILGYALEGLLIYFLVLNVVRTRRTLRRVVWTVLAAGALLGGLSMYQEATGRYQQEFGGLAYRNYMVEQDAPDREGEARRESWHRARGPMDEPNRFAQTLIVLLPLAVFTFRRSTTWRPRIAAAGLGLLVFAGVLLTLSRGAFVAIVLMAGAMMAIGWIRSSRSLVVGLALAGLVIAVAPQMPFLVKRIDSLTSVTSLLGGDPSRAVHETDGATLGRTALMLSAWNVFLDHPIVGVGPGQFPPFYSMEYTRAAAVDLGLLRPGQWRAHSLYLELAAETGVVGLSVFLTIVGALAVRLWRARRRFLDRDPESADLAAALWLSLMAYLWTGIFLHLEYQRYFWLLLAVTSAALCLMHERPRVTPLPAVPSSRPNNFNRSQER